MVTKYLGIIVAFLVISCQSENESYFLDYSKNVINYVGTPTNFEDRSVLAFSDQGAWFAYGFPDSNEFYNGFTGPFLMTQGNGVWLSKSFSYLEILDNSKNKIEFKVCGKIQKSYNSNLFQSILTDSLEINQKLFFESAHSALLNYKIKNISSHVLRITPQIKGELLLNNISLIKDNQTLEISSEVSDAVGKISFYPVSGYDYQINDSSYSYTLDEMLLEPGENYDILITHSFTFPEYIHDEIFSNQKYSLELFSKNLIKRKHEKGKILSEIYKRISNKFNADVYKLVLAKSALTLQNNWRIAAGEIKHEGLFPSYSYKWFHGFWAWDSWKHSAALSLYNPELAKNQIRAMFDFQEPNGFIVDCAYRDTMIERHNYRNTKPPLSAWAVNKVFEECNDTAFVKEIYPKIVLQHNWWYNERDIDKDSLCEYGSTDGSLIAAKWESGMDNAVRFDNAKILKSFENAYSLDQESVDLNSYLYTEKLLLYKFSKIIGASNTSKYLQDASSLKQKIRNNFFDKSRGWFFDTSIDGESFIGDYGCEGWIPLWANVASVDQAEAVHKIMLDEKHFNTFVPLQTLTARSEKFNPDGGYWRGPNWLDQAYFGIRGLLNYNYKSDAEILVKKIINNGEGISIPGATIRENYNPINGKGLEAQNFSWSAAHLILLLTDNDF